MMLINSSRGSMVLFNRGISSSGLLHEYAQCLGSPNYF